MAIAAPQIFIVLSTNYLWYILNRGQVVGSLGIYFLGSSLRTRFTVCLILPIKKFIKVKKKNGKVSYKKTKGLKKITVTEGVLPSNYYYTIGIPEDMSLAMSPNIPFRKRLTSKEGIVRTITKKESGYYVIAEFDEDEPG